MCNSSLNLTKSVALAVRWDPTAALRTMFQTVEVKRNVKIKLKKKKCEEQVKLLTFLEMCRLKSLPEIELKKVGGKFGRKCPNSEKKNGHLHFFRTS